MAKRLNTLDTSIQLRPEDLDFLFTQVSDPDLNTRSVSGFDNNLQTRSGELPADLSYIWHRLTSSRYGQWDPPDLCSRGSAR